MRLTLIIIAFLSLAACGESKDNVKDGLSIATIPDKSCTQEFTGTRLFCNGQETTSQYWDCGIRDGKKCSYYVHYDDASIPGDQSFSDTICLDLDRPGDRGCQ